MTQPIQDILTLKPGTIVELFVLDLNPIGYNLKYYFCNYTNGVASVVWQGQTYTPIPIKVEGYEFSGQGQLPTPQLTISNVMGTVTALCQAYGDLTGATLTRKRTVARYLDGQPTADPNQYFDDDIFTVDRKVRESKIDVCFELGSSLDMQGIQFPLCIITANMCTAEYRSGDCGYAGGAVATIDDVPTTNLALDDCGRRLYSCKLRFGMYSPLNFNGFPGVDNQRY